MPVSEVRLSGLAFLASVTRLLERVRLADPLAGQWEAADLQWWWRKPRRSDTLDQLVWVDDDGPVAAAILTDWAERWSCDPVLVSGVAAPNLEKVWSQALELMADLSPEPIEVLCGDDDEDLAASLAASGFAPTDERDRTYWLAAEDRAPVAPLRDGYRLVDRVADAERPHPMVGRNGPNVAARLAQTTLYDPRLDLAILAPDGEVAGYALFWADPITEVGLVEPVRVHDAHQRRGLALTLVTEGLDRLAAGGVRRMKVSCETEGACALYDRAGFILAGSSTIWRPVPGAERTSG